MTFSDSLSVARSGDYVHVTAGAGHSKTHHYLTTDEARQLIDDIDGLLADPNLPDDRNDAVGDARRDQPHA